MEIKKVLGIGILIVIVVVGLIITETTGHGILSKSSEMYKLYNGQSKSFVLDGDEYTIKVQKVLSKNEVMIHLSSSAEFDGSGPHRLRENIDKVRFGLVYVEARSVKYGNYDDSDNWAKIKVTKIFGLE